MRAQGRGRTALWPTKAAGSPSQLRCSIWSRNERTPSLSVLSSNYRMIGMSDSGSVPLSTEGDPAALDMDLLHRARQGDLAAFESLVGRYQQRVFGLAIRILGQRQDAEDVVQQTFLSVLEHLDSFREESSVATWLLRIATNHALKVLRKLRGLPTVPLDASADANDSGATLPHPEYIAQWKDGPEELAQRAEVRHLLGEALNDLDVKYRLVFILRDVEGCSTRDTAEILGLSEAAVKVRLLRARLQLREQLTRALGDEATRLLPRHDHG
jgi:RNA polymerase sigma-70 factor (ECF subfamily)